MIVWWGRPLDWCSEHLALVIISDGWHNLWMLWVDRFLVSKIGREPRGKRKCAMTGGFLLADKHDVV